MDIVEEANRQLNGYFGPSNRFAFREGSPGMSVMEDRAEQPEGWATFSLATLEALALANEVAGAVLAVSNARQRALRQRRSHVHAS